MGQLLALGSNAPTHTHRTKIMTRTSSNPFRERTSSSPPAAAFSWKGFGKSPRSAADRRSTRGAWRMRCASVAATDACSPCPSRSQASRAPTPTRSTIRATCLPTDTKLPSSEVSQAAFPCSSHVLTTKDLFSDHVQRFEKIPTRKSTMSVGRGAGLEMAFSTRNFAKIFDSSVLKSFANSVHENRSFRVRIFQNF